ncbi:MAG: M20/M25/M40 family metallo-hydrolase [candidate division Zixibacteria bacterium]|nr:M20/M25/M40 family metallo-hydrolase [candidate division Zixibacteria bacterium]
MSVSRQVGFYTDAHPGTWPAFSRRMDTRILPGERRETVIAELLGLFDACAARSDRFKGKADVFFYRDGLEVDREETVVQTLRREAEAVLGRTPPYASMTGWMDTGILNAVGIPSVMFGPGGEGFHAAVEFTYRDQVVRCADILTRTARAFCGEA